MSHLPQSLNQELMPVTLDSQKLAIARNLSKDMAVVQANELLAQDILNKVANLSALENHILTQCPTAKERCDFIIRAFAYQAVKHFK